jgi:hypothetical protein
VVIKFKKILSDVQHDKSILTDNYSQPNVYFIAKYLVRVPVRVSSTDTIDCLRLSIFDQFAIVLFTIFLYNDE